jgi:hypothetical protein
MTHLNRQFLRRSVASTSFTVPAVVAVTILLSTITTCENKDTFLNYTLDV